MASAPDECEEDAATNIDNFVSSNLKLISWKQEDEFQSSDNDSQPKSATLPVDCTEGRVPVEQSTSKACFPPLLIYRNRDTFQTNVLIQMNEIMVRLDKIDGALLQGLEKGDIIVTEAFQQFIKEAQLSDDGLKKLVKQQIWPELIQHREELCDMMCTRIQKIIQNALLHHLSVDPQSVHRDYEKRTSSQSSMVSHYYNIANR